MDLLNRILTWFLLALLAFLVAVALRFGGGVTLLAPTIMAVALAMIPLLMRPTGFDVDAAGLRVRWPLRSKLYPRGALLHASRLDRTTFGTEFGWTVRVGAGGFLGTFGYLWTSKKGWVVVEASRVSDMVWVRTAHESLVLTPEHPDEFVESIRNLTGRGAAQVE